ncbi:hypothetical protein [Streptomyces sp. NPDC057966]|uniref:hypothetical protein n=1 Tax=Streptomyces sp. NPDC057966 TaxID=3346292 RepID=UPI0036E7C0E7
MIKKKPACTRTWLVLAATATSQAVVTTPAQAVELPSGQFDIKHHGPSTNGVALRPVRD